MDPNNPVSGQVSAQAANGARLWPTLLVVLAQVCLVTVWISPSNENLFRLLIMMAGPILCSLAFMILLVFASRLAWSVSLLTILAVILLGITSGMFAAPLTGIAYLIYGIPLVIVAMWGGLAMTHKRGSRLQVVGMVSGAALVWLGMSQIRIERVQGTFLPVVALRWLPSAEEKLLSQSPPSDSAPVAKDSQGDQWFADRLEWPSFRGGRGDGRVTEQLPKMDWQQNPPKELWRRRIGPGWSSMAVVSGRLFTQEQRGEHELVSCYEAATGEPIWQHKEQCRFEEMQSGAGPRATPTFADGRIYAYGAKAVLLALDAADGRLLWRRDLMQEFDAALPIWGFCTSPVVYGDNVVVYAGGEGENGFMAFDKATGEIRWRLSERGMNFSSPQLMKFGEQATLVINKTGATLGLDPSTGKILWQHNTVPNGSPAIVQPQQLDETTLIVPFGDDKGVGCIELSESSNLSWIVQEKWRTRGIKPWYNDYLYHEGHIYGFDKQFFVCIDTKDGSLKWKSRKYGFGQAVLIQSTGQIVLLSEDGIVHLIDVSPSESKEVGSVQVLNDTCWNHPVIAGGRLYVRNSAEMVCLALTP